MTGVRARAVGAALAGAIALLLPVVARAQTLEGKVTRITLDNGMRFLVLRRGTAPVFAANLRFRVGSVDDPKGETGMAHMFEHMAFKGTSSIGTKDPAQEKEILAAMDQVQADLVRERDKGAAADPKRVASLVTRMDDLTHRLQGITVKDEFSQILTSNGAEGLNASTGVDLTSYVVELPSNRLELWCILESSRLRDPVLREFYSERDVVMEERRMRIDTQPQGRMYEALLASAFQAHPYRVPTVGWMSDLEHLSRADAEAFRRRYYTPGNAVVAIVGDVDPRAAETLIRRYFSDLPPGPPPAGPVTVEPPQAGERRSEVAFDAEPEVMIAFHKAVWPSPDDAAFEVIDEVLTSGRTSRLFKSLVLGTQVASDIYSFNAPGDRYPNLFVVGATPRAPHTAGETETALLDELAKLAAAPVDDHELTKIKNQLRASFLYPLRSNSGLAAQLSYFEIITGDWKNLEAEAAAAQSVTAAQIQDVARRTFVASNRTYTLLARPASGQAPGQQTAPASEAAAPGTR